MPESLRSRQGGLSGSFSRTADRELGQTMSQWSREGYHVQHNDALWATVQIALYRGEGAAAWQPAAVDSREVVEFRGPF